MGLPQSSVVVEIPDRFLPVSVMSSEFCYAINHDWTMIPAEVHGMWWIIFPANWEDLYDDACRT